MNAPFDDQQRPQGEREWRACIRGWRRRINLAFWWAGFTRLFLIPACVWAPVILWVRQGGDVPAWVFAGLAGTILGCGMLAALRNRPRYYTDEDATAWLDERLRMDGALCAARSGLRNWPEADGEKLALSPGRWQVRKLAPVFVGSVALLALALLVPMAPATGAGSVPIDRPYAWDTV